MKILPYRPILILIFSLVFSLYSCNDNEVKLKSSTESKSITYSAISDFYALEREQYVPFYIDSVRNVLGVDAMIFKNKFSIAETIFDGASGTYTVILTSMTEIDGESTYRILINDKLVGEFQNQETEIDFELLQHTIASVNIEKGYKIQVEFNSHSNGKIPEDGAFAFSRGRWKGIELVKID